MFSIFNFNTSSADVIDSRAAKAKAEEEAAAKAKAAEEAAAKAKAEEEAAAKAKAEEEAAAKEEELIRDVAIRLLNEEGFCSPSEPLRETANLEELTSEGTCTMVLHPGDILEYDPAEYFISEKDFQVKYECTMKRWQTIQAKKKKTLLSLGPGNAIDRYLEKARHAISGKKKEGMEYAQRKIHELPDAVGNHGDILIKRARENETVQKVLAAGGLRTQAGIDGDLEKGQGPLPTLLRSQGVIAQKVERTTTIDWQDVEAAYTYGYLKTHMPESQLTQCLRSSYGHLDDDLDKAVFIQYRVPGYPEAWLCLLVGESFVKDTGERDTFVKSLNAHAESAKKRKAEQAELEEKEAVKKYGLERAMAEASARKVTFSPSTQSVSSNPNEVSPTVIEYSL